MKATNLKTEYLSNPIGIDISRPRFFWNCDEGKKQTAYQLVIKENYKTLYDSGKVVSSKMTNIVSPIAFHSRQNLVWEVSLWDENNQKGDASTGTFEMGLLVKEDFKAKWIRGDYNVKSKTRYPVDCFKKEFYVKDCKKARLYITSCGLYEARINGKRVGNFVLAPGHTDYNKRIQLQTYDISSILREGKNVIEIELADGWYRGSCGAWGLKNQYGKVTKLFAQLEIVDSNNILTTIVSDNSWSWSNDGERRFADNQDGEILDANLSPSYNGKAKETNCKIVPTSSNNVYIEEGETFKPTLITTPTGKMVLDFGQNIAGYLSFKFNAKKGQRVFLRFGEMFDENGEFTQKNIQCRNKKGTHITPLQQVEYFCKDGLNEYKTKFAIFGFQYVLIESDVKINPEDFTAIAVYSKMEETLKFECSNQLINRFVDSTRWSAKNNHADVPTDCPTRERHGWTGDAQIFTNTASYFFNYAPMARKYINDMYDTQKRNGVFVQISPNGGVDSYMRSMDGSAGWSDAGVLIPYRLYLRYGDVNILKEHYIDMKRYADFKINSLHKHYLTGLPTGVGMKYMNCVSNYGQSYGEWAEPADVRPFTIKDFICPHPEETTAYVVYLLETMIKIASIIGEEQDIARYKKYADKARVGYQHLIETKKYSYDSNRQAKLVRPLYLNLLTDSQKEFAQKRLIKALDDYDWRLGTGFLSTPFILYVLEDMDKEYAYRLLENEKMPGWLFMPKSNANTIWESWEGTSAQGGVASLNHYSKGAVCEWIFGEMCGIKIAGENEFIIAPIVGGNVTSASCEYNSIYGTVSSSWKIEGDKVIYNIVIPANTTAQIKIGKINEIVGKGIYSFEILV